MSRPIFIKGKHVDLVCLTKADAAQVHRWQCDMDLIYLWGSQPFPGELKEVEDHIAQHKQKNSLMLGLQLRRGGPFDRSWRTIPH